MSGSYDVAQICLSGHIINWWAETEPEKSSKFCPKCGTETTTTCPGCHASIRGIYRAYGYSVPPGPRPPAYCNSCGKPYPWTERSLKAAKDLIDLENSFTAQEKSDFSHALDDITRQTPEAQVAAQK